MNNPTSQLKGMDLVKWLDNKLGDPNELWCGRQAVTFLSREVLNELSSCFQALEPHVKMKLIQAIPHLSPKLMQMWKGPLTSLLEIAQRDPDDWIRTLADLFIDYPIKGSVRCDIDDADSHFNRTVAQLQEILDEVIPTVETNIIPPDFLIASHDACQATYGYSTVEPKKHFTLKKSSKAASMLQEAMRQVENLNNPALHKKASSSVVSSLPIRMRSTARRPDNTLPMRGIPSAPLSKIHAGFTNEPKKHQRNFQKREGGAVLIDISDLPAPHMKKRRTAGPAAAKKNQSTDAQTSGELPGPQPEPEQ